METHFTFLSLLLCCSRGSDEGTFDCNSVIQSVIVLGVENKPAAVTVLQSGEEFFILHQFQNKLNCISICHKYQM